VPEPREPSGVSPYFHWVSVALFGAGAIGSGIDLAVGTQEPGEWFIFGACALCLLFSLILAISTTRHRD